MVSQVALASRRINSCHWEGQFNLFDAPGRVCKRLTNVLFLEVRIRAENLWAGMPGRCKTNNRLHCDTYASKARFATHYLRIASDAFEVWHSGHFFIVQRQFCCYRLFDRLYLTWVATNSEQQPPLNDALVEIELQ